VTSRRHLLTITLAVCLAGCAEVPLPQSTGHWTGKFVLTPKEPSAKRESARFRLERSDTMLRLDILGPMNTRLARLETEEGSARLIEASGEVLVAPSAEELMQRVLGVSLPMPMLLAWFEGHPWQDAPALEQGPDHFTQSGWQVAILERAATGNPRRIRLDSQSATLLLLLLGD